MDHRNQFHVIYSYLFIWRRRDASEGVSVCCLEAEMQRGLLEPASALQICSDFLAEETFCSFDMLSIRAGARDVKGEKERCWSGLLVTWCFPGRFAHTLSGLGYAGVISRRALAAAEESLPHGLVIGRAHSVRNGLASSWEQDVGAERREAPGAAAGAGRAGMAGLWSSL